MGLGALLNSSFDETPTPPLQKADGLIIQEANLYMVE